MNKALVLFLTGLILVGCGTTEEPIMSKGAVVEDYLKQEVLEVSGHGGKIYARYLTLDSESHDNIINQEIWAEVHEYYSEDGVVLRGGNFSGLIKLNIIVGEDGKNDIVSHYKYSKTSDVNNLVDDFSEKTLEWAMGEDSAAKRIKITEKLRDNLKADAEKDLL